MEIRIRESGQVLHESEFRALFPNTSLPQLTETVLDELGADAVLNGPHALPTRYQMAFRDGVEQIGDKWFTKYSVSDLDAAGIALKDAEQAKNVRAERDRLLSLTDWRFRSDLTPSQEWKDYCQALRDVPNQTGFPFDITYPTEPSN